DIIIPGGQRLHMPIYIEAVDWEVIAIIIGSSLFVDVTSRCCSAGSPSGSPRHPVATPSSCCGTTAA
ncbi:hypothetical protein, partial [Thiolapillus sp.]|uniref:hypothetical protein n=1 Tax=Thiolapillus sp. TaxID=2017437 RepID=UPI003AF56C73